MSDAGAMAPDTKDWTWVLERRCPQCGLDVRTLDVRDVCGMLRDNTASWGAVLARSDVATRPAPTVWSPLEYACHVRDVLALYDVRLLLMLREDDPLFANWDQDATAVEERYGTQEPGAVRRELEAAAVALIGDYELVDGAQWARRGRRSDGASFTVESFTRYLLHDPVHHLWDVGG